VARERGQTLSGAVQFLLSTFERPPDDDCGTARYHNH
jgi:hypothetical protein